MLNILRIWKTSEHGKKVCERTKIRTQNHNTKSDYDEGDVEGKALSVRAHPTRLCLRCCRTGRRCKGASLLDTLDAGKNQVGPRHLQGFLPACYVASVVLDSLRPHGVLAHQAALSMGFSRQECWSGSPCLPPGDLSHRDWTHVLCLLHWQVSSLPLVPPGKTSKTCSQQKTAASRTERTVRTGHGKTDWLQTGKGVRQVCILSPCLFNLCAEYIMQNAGLDEAQAGIKIAGRNINNLRCADDTTLMA